MQNLPVLGFCLVLLLHNICKSDADGISSSNSLLKELDCGVTLFLNASGVITLPRNPTSNRSRVNCTYIISANRTGEISLNFSSVDRQAIGDSFRECFNESILISCNSDNSSGKYCLSSHATLPSAPLFSKCSVFQMSVSSENYNLQKSVQIPYKVTEECGDTSFTGPTGVITSPHFPLSYPHNLNCVYSIEVGRMNTISLDFLSFNLEGTSKAPSTDLCKHDWVTISCLSEASTAANPSSNKTYCGQKVKGLKLTFSECAFVKLHFVTDSSVTQGGFKLHYAIPAPELNCGETLFTNSSGVVILPKNPTDYLARVNCTYTISTSQTSRISLSVSSFQVKQLLQSFQDCNREKLMIGCVSNAAEELKSNTSRAYCGYSSFFYFNAMFSNCRTLKLSIFSSHYEYRSAFNIPFAVFAVDEDCGNTSYTGPVGFITSPRFPLSYQHSLNCFYSIDSGHMKTVLLHFLSFNLEGTSSSSVCLHDWLTISCISEGSTAENPSLIKKHCGQKTTVETLKFSDCASVRLNFVTDSSVTRGGFKIQYVIKDRDNSTSNITAADIPELHCGDTVFTNSSGVINLPTNPMGFLASVNCTYTIWTNRTSKISLNISSIQLKKLVDSFQDCNRENLTISCVSDRGAQFTPPRGRVYCRNTPSQYNPLLIPLMFTECRTLKLSIRSSNYVFQGTFPISFTVVSNDEECGNSSFSGPTGFITSPLFPLSYPHSLNCVYSIDVSRKSRVLLNFQSFYIEGVSNTNSTDYCNHDWLTMSCLPESSTAVKLFSSRKYCGLKSTPLTFTFSNCSVVMLNFVTDSSITRGGFQLQYTVTPPLDAICGVPVYDRPSGAISFPWNYTNFGNSFDCNYVVNATQPSSISLTIWSISGQSLVGENCQRDWLLITCVKGQTALDHKVSHRSCDYLTSSTELIFPSCTSVRIVFHKDSEATGKPFRIEYTVIRHVNGTTELPTTTSVITTSERHETQNPCANGCEINSDATYCECTTTQSDVQTTSATLLPVTTTISFDVPVTQRTECETSCGEISADDRTTCNCSATQSGEVIFNTQMSSFGKAGYSFLISMTVIVVVIGAICLVILWSRKRLRTQEGEELLLEGREEDDAHLGVENGSTTTGSVVWNSQRN